MTIFLWLFFQSGMYFYRESEGKRKVIKKRSEAASLLFKGFIKN